MTDIELVISKGITLSEFINSFEQSAHTIDSIIASLTSYFDIDTAVGGDLDHLGNLLNLKRYDNDTDEGYRTRILTHISIINERPTGQAIVEAADRILGFQPTILEYPDFDFTPLTGKTHPGILINFTVAQLNAFVDEIAEFGGDVRRIKAAGVATFIGRLEVFTEEYLETLDDSQLLFGAEFTDKTNAIYTGKFGSTVFDYGKFEDETHFIDEFITPLATKLLTEAYVGSLVDELSFVGILDLTEVYSGSLIDTVSLVGVLALTENYLSSLVDVISFTGTIELSENYLASLVDTILLDGTLFLTEVYSGSLVDTPSYSGILLLTENYLSSLVDVLSLTGTLELSEDYTSSLVDTLSLEAILLLTEDYLGSLVDNVSFVGVLSLLEAYSGSLVDELSLTGNLDLSEIFSATPSVTSINKMASTFGIGFSSVGYGIVGGSSEDILDSVVGGLGSAGGKFGFARFDDPTPHLVIIEEYN